jgi:hypothetical protein
MFMTFIADVQPTAVRCIVANYLREAKSHVHTCTHLDMRTETDPANLR